MPGVIFADPVSGAPSFTGKIFRALLSALSGGGPSSRAFGAQSGVNPRTPASILSVTSTVWTVGAHGGYIDTSASGTDGPTPYAFLTAQTGAVNAADASNARYDWLCVQLSDPSEGDGSAVPQVLIVYQAGTPGSPPPAITVPRSFVIGQIHVPKVGDGAPTISFVAPFCVAAGGILPALDSTSYPASPHRGQFLDDFTSGLFRWSGSAWKPIARKASDTINVTVDPDDTVTVHITFPVGLFTATPVVVVSINTGSPQNSRAGVQSPDASGFDLVVWSTTATPSRVISWIASQD